MQALPPNHLYSANVHNKTSKPVSVTVQYQALGHNESKTETIAPNSSKLFEQVTFDQGSSTSVAPVHQIAAKFEDSNDVHTHAPQVQGVNRVKDFHVVEENEAIKVQQL